MFSVAMPMSDEQTLHGFEKSAGKLAVEQIDLLIRHQPLPTSFDLTVGAHKALETLLADGKVRHRRLGLPARNIAAAHRPDLDRPGGAPDRAAPLRRPAPNPGLDAARGILTQVWSPIGGITFHRNQAGEGRGTLDDPVIVRSRRRTAGRRRR